MSLKNQWFLNFNCVLLTVKLVEGLEIWYKDPERCFYPYSQWGLQPSWLNILHVDKKCVLLIIFLAQHLTASDNPISMQLRWIWNSTFWLGAENLMDYRQYVKIRKISYQRQEVIKCHLVLIFTHFLWTRLFVKLTGLQSQQLKR